MAAWRTRAAPSPKATAQPCSSLPARLHWSEDGVQADPGSSSNRSMFLCSSCSFCPAFPFSVMGKSHFLDIADKFESQTMEENSSLISSGFPIMFTLLPLSFVFFYLTQHRSVIAPFSSSYFSGFGFLPCFS